MSQRPDTHRPAHASPLTYVRVALILATITGVEVGLFYFDLPGAAFVGFFFVLSATKFVLVIMFYMHLKYDARLFSWLFVGGLLLAVSILVALVALFGTLLENPTSSALAMEPEPTATATTEPTPTDSPTTTAEPTGEPTPTPTDGAPASGSDVILANGCIACHTITGLGGAVGVLGPELDGVATRAATRVPGLSAEEYIRQSIEDPKAFIVEGFIVPMLELRGTMTDEEFESLVAYLLTLK